MVWFLRMFLFHNQSVFFFGHSMLFGAYLGFTHARGGGPTTFYKATNHLFDRDPQPQIVGSAKTEPEQSFELPGLVSRGMGWCVFSRAGFGSCPLEGQTQPLSCPSLRVYFLKRAPPPSASNDRSCLPRSDRIFKYFSVAEMHLFHFFCLFRLSDHNFGVWGDRTSQLRGYCTRGGVQANGCPPFQSMCFSCV